MTWYTEKNKGFTYSDMKIDQSSASGTTLLIQSGTALVARVHALVGTFSTAGTLTVEDTKGSDLSGPMSMDANGGLVIPNKDDGWYTAASGEGIRISTTGKFNGSANCSRGAY